MNGIQLSVCLPGADAGTIVKAARVAESFNLDIWAGDRMRMRGRQTAMTAMR